MANQWRVGSHATSIRTDGDGWTRVRYHSTDVVSFKNGEVILNSGGWRTNTTKTRMNQANNQFGLGYRVFQKNHDWFVEDRESGEVANFEDLMRLPASFSPTQSD